MFERLQSPMGPIKKTVPRIVIYPKGRKEVWADPRG
jgi:hypothetical protein